MIKDKVYDYMIKEICVECGKQYECSELYAKMVECGKIESICGYCDESNKEK